jgi:hypothetical protein
MNTEEGGGQKNFTLPVGMASKCTKDAEKTFVSSRDGVHLGPKQDTCRQDSLSIRIDLVQYLSNLLCFIASLDSTFNLKLFEIGLFAGLGFGFTNRVLFYGSDSKIWPHKKGQIFSVYWFWLCT